MDADIPNSVGALPEEPKIPEFTNPPISSLKRRAGAFLIDGIIIGGILQLLGWSMSSYWFKVGPYGRLVGFALAVLYFGLAYSKLFNGQTVGKRLLKIAVRNSKNSPVGLGLAFCRVGILWVPALLNGWALPGFTDNGVVQWLAAVILFGVGVAMIYTMIFTRKTHQGLHDMICGTYVVYLPGTPIESFPRTGKRHIVISGAIVGVAIVLASLMGPISAAFFSNADMGNMQKISKAFASDDRFFSAKAMDNTFSSSLGKSTRSISVDLWYKGAPSPEEKTAAENDAARTVLANITNTGQYDSIRIDVYSAWDLFMSSGRISDTVNLSPGDWTKRLSGSVSR
jgi:uncharacterized RDD family membrane protein YckC